jgi:hypothetical protein
MQKSDTHAFVNQLLVYTLVMICVSGSVGLGTVWLRYQISVTANRNKQLETRISEVERHLAETNNAIETEQGPSMLMRRNTEWRLGLVQTRESQVIHVSEPLRASAYPEASALAAAKSEVGGLTRFDVAPVLFRLGKNR